MEFYFNNWQCPFCNYMISEKELSQLKSKIKLVCPKCHFPITLFDYHKAMISEEAQKI